MHKEIYTQTQGFKHISSTHNKHATHAYNHSTKSLFVHIYSNIYIYIMYTYRTIEAVIGKYLLSLNTPIHLSLHTKATQAHTNQATGTTQELLHPQKPMYYTIPYSLVPKLCEKLCWFPLFNILFTNTFYRVSVKRWPMKKFRNTTLRNLHYGTRINIVTAIPRER